MHVIYLEKTDPYYFRAAACTCMQSVLNVLKLHNTIQATCVSLCFTLRHPKLGMSFVIFSSLFLLDLLAISALLFQFKIFRIICKVGFIQHFELCVFNNRCIAQKTIKT